MFPNDHSQAGSDRLESLVLLDVYTQSRKTGGGATCIITMLKVCLCILFFSCYFFYFRSPPIQVIKKPNVFRDVPIKPEISWDHLAAAFENSNLTFGSEADVAPEGCQLPVLDPWDPEILDFVGYLPSAECASKQKSVLFTTQVHLVILTMESLPWSLVE